MRRARTAFVTAAPLALRTRALSLCRTLRPYTPLACRPQTTPHIHRITPLASAQQHTPWNRVRVVENSPECEDHRYIVVNVGVTAERGSLCDEYRMPGMFVQLRPNPQEKPSFFALACAPNIAGYFEFIIKQTEATNAICSVKEGDEVEISPIMGNGFPMPKLNQAAYDEPNKPKDILLFATGSGIAPIRAAIESRLNGLDVARRRSVKLFYGARYPERMPCRSRFGMWQQDGIEIIPVMSRPQQAAEKWEGRTGYVQHVLNDIGVEHPSQTAALLCGVKGMTEHVRRILTDAGVPEDRILLNF